VSSLITLIVLIIFFTFVCCLVMDASNVHFGLCRHLITNVFVSIFNATDDKATEATTANNIFIMTMMMVVDELLVRVWNLLVMDLRLTVGRVAVLFVTFWKLAIAAIVIVTSSTSCAHHVIKMVMMQVMPRSLTCGRRPSASTSACYIHGRRGTASATTALHAWHTGIESRG